MQCNALVYYYFPDKVGLSFGQFQSDYIKLYWNIILNNSILYCNFYVPQYYLSQHRFGINYLYKLLLVSMYDLQANHFKDVTKF